jgi:hypothetical protein
VFPADVLPEGSADQPDLIYVGHACPLCYADGECPLCDGAGETGELVTFEAFRAMTSLAGPPRPSLV